jgi:hypothetical protein
MLLVEKATPEQVKQFYTLPIRAQKQIVRNFDRKNKRQSDPHRLEKMKAAQAKRNRQGERQGGPDPSEGGRFCRGCGEDPEDCTCGSPVQ